MRSLLCCAAAGFIAAANVAKALVVSEPSEATLWSAETVYFDVYIRNAAPGMYEPGLNTSIATSVDSSMGNTLNLTNISQFRAGGGYQLFLSDPTDASLVYCGSDVFAISAPETAATSLPSASASSGLSPSVSEPTASVSVSAPVSTSTKVSTSTETETVTLTRSDTITSDVPTATTGTTSSRSSAFHSARPPHSIGQAIAPGSPEDQGFNLVSRASPSVGPLSSRASVTATGVLAVTAFFLLL
ncbi:hypothetical protein JCM10908_000886 [Rhodotorula pacifica]|uniref:uncharacterized protein n=1 Tax=Rhodotorula pacifica TaxID=1495444 RepID=UPI003180AB56